MRSEVLSGQGDAGEEGEYLNAKDNEDSTSTSSWCEDFFGDLTLCCVWSSCLLAICSGRDLMMVCGVVSTRNGATIYYDVCCLCFVWLWVSIGKDLFPLRPLFLFSCLRMGIVVDLKVLLVEILCSFSPKTSMLCLARISNPRKPIIELFL